MRARMIAVSAVVWAGCAPEPVPFELNFPSQETFLHSEFAQVRAFLLEADDLGACPMLIGDVVSGAPLDEVMDTGRRPVCEFLEGEAEVDPVGTGPHAWVAIVTNATNSVLLYGCTVAEVYDSAPPVRVALYMTDTYRSVAAGDPPFASLVAKCGDAR